MVYQKGAHVPEPVRHKTCKVPWQSKKLMNLSQIGPKGYIMSKNTKTPAMVLQEFTVKRGFSPPAYEITYSITGSHVNRFDYVVSVAGIQGFGTGHSKQIGKHNAAQEALNKLQEMGLYNPLENPVQEYPIPTQSGPKKISFKSNPNCIAPLKDMCMENKIPYPEFTLVSDVGPPHCREFTYECSVASIKTIATGSTKKLAKQYAAKQMMERLDNVLPEIFTNHCVKKDVAALTDKDNKALQIYNEFYGSIVPDKAVKIEDYSTTLKKLMKKNYVEFEDFSVEFSTKTEDALKSILVKLGLNYKFYEMQENMVSLSFNTDTPFTTIGVSNTVEEAKAEALASAFEIMEVYMQI